MASDPLGSLFDLIRSTPGAELNRVAVEEFSGAGRGVRVKTAIQSGQVAIGIPHKFIITANVSSPCLSDDSEVYRKWIMKMGKILSGAELLSLILLRLLERSRSNLSPSDWRSLYLRTLPLEYTTISYWSEADKKMFSAASSVLAEELETAERTCKISCEKIRQATGGRYAMEDIEWAYWTIETRGCYHRLGGVCLVPLGDMVNHSAEAYSTENCGKCGMQNRCGNYNVREHRYEFTAMRDYNENEQFFVVYSGCASTDLLMRYGFSTLTSHLNAENCQFESVRVSPGKLWSSGDAVQQLIEGGLFVCVDGSLSHSFATTARLKIARDHGVTASLKNVVVGDSLGNVEHEQEARELCGDVIQEEIDSRLRALSGRSGSGVVRGFLRGQVAILQRALRKLKGVAS